MEFWNMSAQNIINLIWAARTPRPARKHPKWTHFEIKDLLRQIGALIFSELPESEAAPWAVFFHQYSLLSFQPRYLFKLKMQACAVEQGLAIMWERQGKDSSEGNMSACFLVKWSS